MTNRSAIVLLALSAMMFALLGAVGTTARADAAKENTAKPSDYGLTEGERRTGAPEQMGAFVFSQRCSVCHARSAGGPTVYGPHLAGIVGRVAGETDWPKQTPVLKSSGVVWDEAMLDKLLLDPQEAMPGVKMDVVVRFRRSRKALIAYLKTL